MRAFIVSADDRPGMVASATGAAGAAGVNLRVVAGIADGTTGLLALIGDDDAKLRAALAARGGPVREVELVTTHLEDRPGAVAEVASRLSAAGVSLNLVVQLGTTGGRVEVAFAASDVAALRRALG